MTMQAVHTWPWSQVFRSHRHRHRLPEHLHVMARPILGGLQYEYRLEKNVA
jgi:hypothetical protein